MVQVVDRMNMSYVYSAYIDDRKTPDVEPSWLPVLRVFTWLRRRESVTTTWRCVFWDEDFSQPVEGVVVGWTDLNKFDSSTE